ncbi:MAG: glycosyltransferase [Ruthenibacterium sp.]
MSLKKILFIYPEMFVGGSTTSLLSLFQVLNPDQYQMDLLLMHADGILDRAIPEYVNVLPCIFPQGKEYLPRMWKGRSPAALFRRIGIRAYSILLKRKLARMQLCNAYFMRFAGTLSEQYDVAISFLEGFPLYYLASNKVVASKKYAWIHTDYVKSQFAPILDKKYFANLDKIIFVADACVNNFVQAVPEFAAKAICIHNILDAQNIRDQAGESCENMIVHPQNINFVTACRIDFSSKALDRAVQVLDRIKTEHQLTNFCWYIIGDGPDFSVLQQIIADCKLENQIILLGQKENPCPYIAQCNVFFLPSRYEGMPMSITEAQILGVVPLVTQYSSASEQINHGVDGIIVPNDEKGIYDGVVKILSSPEIVPRMQKALRQKNFGNEKTISSIQKMLDE